MSRFKSALIALFLAAFLPVPADAQVTLDVSKITCDQFTGYKITDPRNIALWLSGYYNGKKNNTILEPQKLTSNIDKLTQYCLTNPKVIVMKAVEKLFEGGN